MNFLIGFLGGLAVVALLALGCCCGWFAHKTFSRPAAVRAKEPEDAERRRIEEEEQAFGILKNYSMERAYGMVDDAPRGRGVGGERR